MNKLIEFTSYKATGVLVGAVTRVVSLIVVVVGFFFVSPRVMIHLVVTFASVGLIPEYTRSA